LSGFQQLVVLIVTMNTGRDVQIAEAATDERGRYGLTLSRIFFL
jgi:hypothetical protein